MVFLQPLIRNDYSASFLPRFAAGLCMLICFAENRFKQK